MGDEADLQAIGRELRKHRKARGLSQEALADMAGLHTNHVGMIERGERNPTALVLIALARALGVSAADFFGGA